MNEIRFLLEAALKGVGSLGIFAPWAYVPIFVMGTLIFIPTAVLTLAAGALFGIRLGFVVALTASMAGASAGFLAGRYFSRDWVLKKFILSEKFKALDMAVAARGWKIVLLLRLSATFPFTFLNYGLGLSRISFKHYFLASLAGSIPGTALYVTLGSLAGKLVFASGPMQKSPLEWGFVVFGFAVTIGMGIYSVWVVKHTLPGSAFSLYKIKPNP